MQDFVDSLPAPLPTTSLTPDAKNLARHAHDKLRRTTVKYGRFNLGKGNTMALYPYVMVDVRTNNDLAYSTMQTRSGPSPCPNEALSDGNSRCSQARYHKVGIRLFNAKTRSSSVVFGNDSENVGSSQRDDATASKALNRPLSTLPSSTVEL